MHIEMRFKRPAGSLQPAAYSPFSSALCVRAELPHAIFRSLQLGPPLHTLRGLCLYAPFSSTGACRCTLFWPLSACFRYNKVFFSRSDRKHTCYREFSLFVYSVTRLTGNKWLRLTKNVRRLQRCEFQLNASACKAALSLQVFREALQ